ncbi:CHAT domain-containing protein [Acidiphilium iwatense]|uniref:CHAT domain-containing protein n=1 Tax=Acidiphilium iwatense TaxID=768198 RepID=A0ABS9E0C2_9PROT|nr:CHAT domain-containing tetratricopeptide repeat protein [Acidiphilium iwatense]MCF3948471.1 CHAT domain-containing protein [Acidiphilium iwatense]
MRRLITLACMFGLMVLAGCAQPPPTAYVTNSAATSITGRQYAIGRSSSGEACTVTRTAHGALVYCGTWHHPSARVVAGSATDPTGLAQLAETGSWRAGLEQRYACAAPKPATILGRYPAQILLCTQRIGGWPHVAIAALIGGRAWLADGVQPAFPVMQRAIGIASRVVAPKAARNASVAISDRLLADRLAASAFTSGDIGQYEALMRVGNNANQAEDYPAAVTAYRAALALQQKALGPADPNTVAPMMDLALNLSDEGRYRQADTLFAQAKALAPKSADATATPRLLHYRGLDALNQGHDRQAQALLAGAERGYAALLPASLITPHALVATRSTGFALSAGGGTAQILTAQTTLLSPVSQQALLGVIETLRYQGVVQASLGHPKQAAATIRRSSMIAVANGITPPILQARLDRTAATIDTATGQNGAAASRLAAASRDFAQALPGSRPVADTSLLQGAVLARSGETAQSIQACRQGVSLLRRLRLGTSARLIAPCLEALDTQATHTPNDAQALYAEMFGMAELAQGSTTSQEIAETAARLAANSKSPAVAAAIRAHQDAVVELARLYRARDDLAHGHGNSKPALAALDARIAAASRTLSQADEAVEAAAPNFGQLVQESVPARSVLAQLHPHEAFLDIMLASHHAWLFLLQNGKMMVARSGTGDAKMTRLVEAVRRSLKPTQSGLPPFAMTDAAAIYQATVAPFKSALIHTTAMVIAPSGPLLSLPFALLPAGPAQAGDLRATPWLIRRMSLVYVPAAANFVSLRRIQGTSQASQPWFGFGDFDHVTEAEAAASFSGPACANSARLFAGLPSLPYAKLELAAARAVFHAPASDQLLGAAFTVPDIERADLKQFRILHFATHALLPSELPCAREPAIVTSPPPGARSANRAMLTTSDITNLHLDANLVILSACNTGGSNGRAGGEALSGLARAFFFAGARGLMVTQWAVNDQVSSYLVATTLQHIASGSDGGAASSLRSAQLALIDGAGTGGVSAKLANPFYWAPFVVIGDGGEQAASVATYHPVGAAKRTF